MSKRRMGGGGSRGRKIGPMLASGKMGRDPKGDDLEVPVYDKGKWGPKPYKKGGKVKSRRAGLARRRR